MLDHRLEDRHSAKFCHDPEGGMLSFENLAAFVDQFNTQAKTLVIRMYDRSVAVKDGRLAFLLGCVIGETLKANLFVFKEKAVKINFAAGEAIA